VTRISVSLDDTTAAAVQLAAKGSGSVSGWVANLIREALVNRAATAAGAYDRAHDDPDAEAARLAGDR
jgi:hypothetical protein